uniref:Tektin n=1 Tax=Oncorhynchus mykiss TaxID=8022 RepID=A0A8C7SIH1_ONCMY
MATTSRKPGQRYWVTDWETNNKLLTDTAEHQRHHSQQTRQEGRALRDDQLMFTSIPHNNKTRWDESDSRDRLVDRINEVTEQKDRLQFCVQAMEREIKALTQVKEETERALAETAMPLEVVVECLTQREGRRGSELVSDPLEGQLKREAQMIDTMQQELQQHISKAFEQLCCLKEAHQQLTFDLSNKTEALDVDLSCLSLTDRSPDISFKPDPTHVPISASTHQEWEQFTHYNVTRAEEEMQASLQLRETMTSTRIQVFLRLLSADSVILWLCLSHQTREEITELLRDIHHLEQDLLATECPLKLVHTRLENRNSRPGVDLCRDQVTLKCVVLSHTTMPQMSQVLRECAICMLTAGLSTRVDSRELNVNFSPISSLQCSCREFGSTSNRPHNRRPRVTSLSGFFTCRVV